MNRFSSAVWVIAICSSLAAQTEPPRQEQLRQGPLIGHTSHNAAQIWARAAQAGNYRLTATSVTDPAITHSVTAVAKPQHDLCMVFALAKMQADHSYAYRIAGPDGTELCGGKGFRLRTAPALDADAAVRIMFGSCCREDEGTGDTWKQVGAERPDTVVLLGDTPYIDSTKLARQRHRYAEFAAFAPMAELLRTTSWYGTWDDHDFGSNDTDGRVRGKARSRQAFVEYHANPSYGDGQAGMAAAHHQHHEQCRDPAQILVDDCLDRRSE